MNSELCQRNEHIYAAYHPSERRADIQPQLNELVGRNLHLRQEFPVAASVASSVTTQWRQLMTDHNNAQYR